MRHALSFEYPGRRARWFRRTTFSLRSLVHSLPVFSSSLVGLTSTSGAPQRNKRKDEIKQRWRSDVKRVEAGYIHCPRVWTEMKKDQVTFRGKKKQRWQERIEVGRDEKEGNDAEQGKKEKIKAGRQKLSRDEEDIPLVLKY